MSSGRIGHSHVFTSGKMNVAGGEGIRLAGVTWASPAMSEKSIGHHKVMSSVENI